MARVDLDVPFSEKDEAKALGARWDPQAKVWFVPEGRDSAPLARWLPQHHESDFEPEPEYPIRAPYYFVIESKSGCWKCGSSTRVHAFMLPEEHEQFEYADEEDEGFTLGSPRGYWERYGERGKMSNVYGLSPSVLAQLRTHTSRYKPAYSHQAGETYCMNHCEQCGAKLGDFYMHSEPGGAFSRRRLHKQAPWSCTRSTHRSRPTAAWAMHRMISSSSCNAKAVNNKHRFRPNTSASACA